MFSCWIWMFILLCGSSIADENSIRDADIFPSSPEIERGSTLKLFCVLGKHYTPQRNASHIIWKLNRELIAQENYNIVNETVSSVIIHNFTYNKAHVKCFIKYLGKEQLLVHTEVKSGFPPDTPGNISCIYYFNVELTCNWTSGRETNLATIYTLYRKIKNKQGLIMPDSELSSCRSKTESCSFRHPNTPFSNSFCFQVKAQNVLGEASSDCVPIAMENIEKFEPPEILSVKKVAGIKQLLTVTWKIPEDIIPAQYLNCQVRYRNLYSNSSEIDTVAVTSEEKVVSLNLTGLWDSTEYSVAVRCIGVESKFWSEWCTEKTASTEEKAPSEKVDLWRIIESSHPAGNRSVHLIWKLLSNIPPPGRILGYKIQYFPENNAVLQMTNITTNKKIVLPLNEEAYIISVTAYNSAGNSPAAILRIPSIDEKPPEIIETVRTYTTNEEMIVEWIASEPEVTEYVVEWYEELETDPFIRSWQYISNSTKWKANKKIFKPFVCYNMSVYPLYGKKVAAPYSIQTYVQEKDETVNSDVLHHRLKSLQANTQYTVHIMASNRAGGTSGEPKTFKTLKFNKEDIIFIAIPVGLSMFFLLGLWITCILKKHTFKKVCWPDIPNPAESVAVEWPLDAPMSNSFLKGVTYEDKTVGLEDVSVLEDCFPEEDHEGLLLMNCEKHVSECTDSNVKGVQSISEHKITLLNGNKKILYNEEHEVAKCLSPSMPYVITGEDFRSQMHSALIPAKKIQPIEMLEDDLHETQQISVKNEESDNEEALKLEGFSEKTLFNPYLRNSVKTREFLISENLPEHSKNEPKKQPTVLPAFQQNAVGQSYITLDIVGLATAH
ncbi:interleukin-31 receptor subunit alpha isoform X3 [Cygnus atratus]|uniref:interleukin-31 receptor subunit alpha isoform X3 n=1 Tax=Cygnus atratus TaxID=8868 RepID=UPI0015D5766D|nr:interleukin-31 receptor subunit alpha isoform X3 [Cygnus atratus]XP_050572539.1 interleukin-31 receptor subunit alpha isoform X3 [Cygnus atratus]